MIPYGKQTISRADIEAVVSVLNSDFLTQGSQVPAFEQAVAKYCSSKFAVATNSATSGLHVACLALGLGDDDWLWTSPISFVASANCGLYCGAQINFVDIDPDNFNICISELEAKLVDAEKENKLPKILVVVHMSGHSCDMKAIYMLSKQYGFCIIEDASHAIGGQYLNNAIGSCQYSDITVFSFHPVKIITTAEGGMVLTNNDYLAKKMASFRSHGITREPDEMTHPPEGPWYYQQVDLGFNYRMTDIQAALGLSQLKQIDSFVSKRRQLAKCYDSLLKDLPVKPQVQINASNSSFHLYVIRIQLDQINRTRKQVFEKMRELNIGVNVHYIPIHTQPYFEKFGFKVGDFQKAEKYYEEALSLPLFPGMTEAMLHQIVDSLRIALNE